MKKHILRKVKKRKNRVQLPKKNEEQGRIIAHGVQKGLQYKDIGMSDTYKEILKEKGLTPLYR